MSNPIIFTPPPIELPDPPAPLDLVAFHIARRARITIAHAALVAALAGFGPQEAR